MKWSYRRFRNRLFQWLVYEPPSTEVLPFDFDRLTYEIRPGDVLLVEGRSRVSGVIRTVMQSSWTHAALYIGRLRDLEDYPELFQIVESHVNAKEINGGLIIEDLLDVGTVVNPLTVYNDHHLRICRPIGITPSDVQEVLSFAIRSLGQPYNVRQVFDLFRFFLPWTLLPRRFRSSLFRTPSGEPESGICSSLIAKAFRSVHFPILPFMKLEESDSSVVEVIQRSPYLFTPKDFDYSPYFEIIKYPLFNPEEPLPYYRRLPWARQPSWHLGEGLKSQSSSDAKPEKEKRSFFSRKSKTDSEPPETD